MGGKERGRKGEREEGGGRSKEGAGRAWSRPSPMRSAQVTARAKWAPSPLLLGIPPS